MVGCENQGVMTESHAVLGISIEVIMLRRTQVMAYLR